MQVLRIVLPLLLSLGLGFLARKRALLSAEAIEGLKTFAMRFALPALIFGLFFTTQYSLSVLLFAATMFSMGCLGLLLGHLLSRLFALKSPMTRFMTAGWEVGMLGYALYALLFGTENLRYMAVLDFGQVLFVFTVYIALLNARNGGKPRDSLRLLLRNPIPWAILLGALGAISGLSRALEPSGVTALITSCCDFVSAPLSCVILVVVGYGITITRKRFATAAVPRRCALCTPLCVLAPGLSACSCRSRADALGADSDLLTPAPFILTFYANEEERADVSTSRRRRRNHRRLPHDHGCPVLASP